MPAFARLPVAGAGTTTHARIFQKNVNCALDKASQSDIGSVLETFKNIQKLTRGVTRNWGTLFLKMECSECSRLMADHARLWVVFALAKRRLREGIKQRLSPPECETLLRIATEALVEADHVKSELEEHKRVHSEAN